ncbi:MAG: CdaR family protein [Cellulosilyticaceae bacterium]
MNKFFTNNLPWKIFSLALASMLWLFVINTQNPLQPREIRDIQVNIRGLSELEARGFVIQNEEELRNTKVKVSVRGPRLEIDRIQANKSLIDVTLDLTPFIDTLSDEVESAERIAAFDAKAKLGGVTVETMKPKTTYLIFEKEKTVTKRIEPNIIGAGNNQYLAPIVKPSTIEISGPKSKINRIHEVSIDINVDQFSADALSFNEEIKVLDKEGNEVTGIKKSPQFAQVTLPIGTKKRVPLEAQFKGTLPSGYIQTNTLISPKEITIVGKPEVVNNIHSIKLEPIALDNMIQTDAIKVNYILPDEVECIDDIEDKILVTVEIQKESTYEYHLPTKELNIQTIGLSKNYKYEVLQDTLQIVLAGTAEKLLVFDPKTLVPVINLSGLAPGEYSIPVQVAIPEPLKVLNKPLTLKLRIYDPSEDVVIPEEPTVTPPPTEEVLPPVEEGAIETTPSVEQEEIVPEEIPNSEG